MVGFVFLDRHVAAEPREYTISVAMPNPTVRRTKDVFNLKRRGKTLGFCQDKLGLAVFFTKTHARDGDQGGAPPVAGSDDWQVGKEYGETESPEPVSKNGLFEPFIF